jgi:hypothetical protein
MSLLDRLAEVNLTSVREFHVSAELTDDEKLGLREMFESSGWKIITTKLWPYVLQELVLRALVVPTDQRFYQGMFTGYKRLVDLAKQYEGGFDQKTAEELFENFEDPTGYNLLH